MPTRHALVPLIAALAAAACQKTPLVQPADLEPRGEAVSADSAAPRAPAAAPNSDFATAQPGKSDPECEGPFQYAAEEKLTLNGKPATLNGYRLTLGTAPAGGPLAIGVVASLNDPSPANVRAFEGYIAAFKAKGAQAILIDGDSGDAEPAIEASLKTFAKSGLPVLALIGNREPKGAFLDAVAAVHKEFPNLINLNTVREVDFGGITLLSLPGYHDPKFLIAGQDGCVYHSEDLAALKKVAADLKTPILLVAHGQPHQEGSRALDRTAAPSVNAGDPALARLLVDAHIAFGVFANIIEAGGHAVSRNGDQAIPAGTFVDALYLNPGAGDTTPWAMNDGTSAKGLAAILEFKDGKGSYTVIKANPAPAAQGPAPSAAK